MNLRQIIEGATAGPWHRHECKAECAQVWSTPADDMVAICDTAEMGEGFSNEQANKNAQFIAASRQALPAALALIRETAAVLSLIYVGHPNGMKEMSALMEKYAAFEKDTTNDAR